MADRTTATVILEAILRDEDARKELQKLQKSTEGIGKAGKKVGRGSKSWLSKIKIGWVAVAAAVGLAARTIIRLGRDTIKAASDFEEANAKFGTVFRGVIDEANMMRDELVRAYAMSRTEATTFLSSIQDMLVPMGLARGKAAEMGGEIVKLAADLGSFNNMPTAEVMRGIQSALAGQIEPMRQYGVFLTQNRIEQEALNLGLVEAGEELTTVAKAQATLSIITQDSGDAIGDMQRTAGSFANQMKFLRATIADLKVDLGEKLLAAIRPTIDFLTAWFREKDNIDKLRRAFEFLGNVIKKGADFVLSIVKAYQKMSAAIREISDLITLTAEEAIKKDQGRAAKRLQLLEKTQAALRKDVAARIELEKQATIGLNRIGKERLAALQETALIRTRDLAKNAKEIAFLEKMLGAQRVKLTNAAMFKLLQADRRRLDGVKETNDSILEDEKETNGLIVEDKIETQEEITDLTDEAFEARKLWAEKELEEWRRLQDQRVELLKKATGMMSKLVGGFTDLWVKSETRAITDVRDRRISAIDAWEARRIADIDSSITDEFTRGAVITGIKKDAQRQRDEIAKDAWKFQKELQVQQANIDMGLAIVKTLATVAFPWNLVAAMGVAALSLAQIDQMKAQQRPTAPAYAAGGVAGLRGPEMALLGEGGPEIVVPAAQTKEILQGGTTSSMSIGTINLEVGGGEQGARDLVEELEDIADRTGRESFLHA